MEEYQGLLENNGLVGYAQEVLKETDPSCFVQTAKQLHARYLFEVQVLFQDVCAVLFLGDGGGHGQLEFLRYSVH